MTGIFVVDKPSDWTSHDVVNKMRGILHEKRVGHSGTLDPMATGVLVVFSGRATRAVQFAEADDKEYVAGIKLGIKTNTQDITVEVLEKTDSIPNIENIIRVIDKFRGEIQQIPPMYSAIKIDGKKLYDLARQGMTVERKPRTVNIKKLEILSGEKDEFLLDIECSKGTYVRTLCNDIGENLGCGACMSSLRRIRAGVFTEEDSHTLEEISEDPEKYVLPIDTLFKNYDEIVVRYNQEKLIRNGNQFNVHKKDGIYRVYSENHEFLMIGAVENNCCRTIKSFFEVNNG